MGYFGGLGAGKGWLKSLFLVGPEVLRDLLHAGKPVLVKTNGRVPADYEATALKDYIEAYTRYLEAMVDSPEAAKRSSMEIYMGLAASVDRFSPKLSPDSRYKLMNPEEPVVNLSPLMLDYDGKQLRTNVMSDFYFGLELSFPRVISLDRDKHETLYDTSKFSTFHIFEDVKSRIQKMTTPCRIRSPSREHRTSIRITSEMRELIRRHHPGLKAASLDIV